MKLDTKFTKTPEEGQVWVVTEAQGGLYTFPDA